VCVLQVVSPNIYNFDLWKTSGHAEHYRENMFAFDVEKAEYGLKPMNCPGHCLMFGNRVRSYRWGQGAGWGTGRGRKPGEGLPC
jgi:threonyl-tRNA synthetase